MSSVLKVLKIVPLGVFFFFVVLFFNVDFQRLQNEKQAVMEENQALREENQALRESTARAGKNMHKKVKLRKEYVMYVQNYHMPFIL